MKLTLVSIVCRGQRNIRFVELPMVNGRAECPISIINEMLAEIGCYSDGLTITIGG